jgi:four helix bundle protein
MSKIESYQDLKVWQEGMILAEKCYKITTDFPPAEQYGMISQIRRAAVSAPANIAEGYGRETRGDYIRFLRIAQGSLKELETLIVLSTRVNLVTQPTIQPLLAQSKTVGVMLRSLIRALERKK